MTHIIVPRVHPLKYVGLRLFWIIVGAALIWGAFELGYEQAHKDIIEGRGGRDTLLLQLGSLQQDLDRLQQENNDLQDEKLQLDRKLQLENDAVQLLKDAIHANQKSITLLNRDLAFYKAMLAPAEDKDSIFVQLFEIHSLEEKHLYEYKLIIAQKVKKRKFATGTVKLLVKGTQDGKPVTLTFDSITEEKVKSLKYRFKYFQTFNGSFSLPENMQPDTVSVTINSKTPKQLVEYNDLPWSANGGIIDVGQ